MFNPDTTGAAFEVFTFVTDDAAYDAMRRSFMSAGMGPPLARFVRLADARRGGSDVDPFAAIRLLRSRANTPYWILCHQDVRLDQGPQADDLLAALIELEEIDPTWAVAGNAGGTADMRIVRRLVDRFGGSTLNQWQHS
jgi:hypothetical protein